MSDLDLAAQIRQLADIEEIKQLKAKYFRCIDTKQWDEWATVFSQDAVLDVVEAGMVLNGPGEIVATVSNALTGAQTVHHGHTPEIELTGHDTASGVWAMADYVEWPSEPGAPRAGLRGFGHYHESYVREDGAWRISRSRLDRIRVDPLA